MGKHGESERIVFKGEVFRRYPDSPDRSLRAYFTSQGGRRLHRVLWEAKRGPIPKGYHVHHINENTLDNRLRNLRLIEGRQHLREHASMPERVAVSRRSIQKAIAAAPAWHASPAGLAWHAEQGRNSWRNRKSFACTCVVCNRSFESKVACSEVCGGACHAKRRRDSGVDDEDRACAWCSATFRTSRYSRQSLCSRSCLARRTNAARRARLQPQRS